METSHFIPTSRIGKPGWNKNFSDQFTESIISKNITYWWLCYLYFRQIP